MKALCLALVFLLGCLAYADGNHEGPSSRESSGNSPGVVSLRQSVGESQFVRFQQKAKKDNYKGTFGFLTKSANTQTFHFTMQVPKTVEVVKKSATEDQIIRLDYADGKDPRYFAAVKSSEYTYKKNSAETIKGSPARKVEYKKGDVVTTYVTREFTYKNGEYVPRGGVGNEALHIQVLNGEVISASLSGPVVGARAPINQVDAILRRGLTMPLATHKTD